MPDRSQRRKPRKLSTVEFYCALIWLAQAGSSLAFRKENHKYSWRFYELEYPKAFTDLSYVWSIVGLIAMVAYNMEHASRILSARKNHNNQSYVVACMIGLFIAAFGLTCSGLYLCLAIQQTGVTVSRVGPMLLWIVFEVCVFCGLGLEAFKQTLLISGWFLIAGLAVALFSYGLMVPAGLYALVALLWTFNYLLKFDLI